MGIGRANKKEKKEQRQFSGLGDVFRVPSVSGNTLSGGDLILIYSRVPNKLVFAVVTSPSLRPSSRLSSKVEAAGS